MAKIICAYSGIEFACEHLPFYLSSREIAHPLFSVSKKKLLSLAARWSKGELSPTENYLLYLSLLHSTDLIEWRVPAVYSSKTPAIIANNMEQLLHIIGKIDIIKHPSFVLPHFVITQDTRSLDNSYHWIQVWNQNYNDWAQNIKDHSNDQELERRESSLQKLLKSSHRNIEDYPKILANWARVAADFPTFTVNVKGVKQGLDEYWESIIIKCAKQESIFQVPENDLKELIEHCEDNIVADGSIYAIALMKFLRKGADMQKNYLGLGDVDLSRNNLTSYRILSPETSAEDANIQNMIDTAPLSEPNKRDYPDLISYIKAKAKWTVSQTYKNESGNTP